MKYLMMTIVLLMLGGCIENKDEKVVNGRYTLTASITTNGMYRLDTVTGEIKWCRPTGTDENSYKLKCVIERP